MFHNVLVAKSVPIFFVCHIIYIVVLLNNLPFLLIFAEMIWKFNSKTMKKILLFIFAALLFAACTSPRKIYNAKDFGIVPGTGEDMTEKIARAIETIKRFTQRCDERTYEEPCTLLPEDIDIIERENFDKQVNWHFKIREREEVDMAWLRPTIEKFLKAQLQRASLDQDDARDVFRRRVAVRGFRLGMMCYALWDKPRPSDLQKCIPFIEWWMNKDIESSLQLWGERYNNETQAVPIMSQRSLYTALGDTFTKNDVYAQCLKQNIKTPVRKIVSLWCNQGHAKVIGKNEYQKTKPASK